MMMVMIKAKKEVQMDNKLNPKKEKRKKKSTPMGYIAIIIIIILWELKPNKIS